MAMTLSRTVRAKPCIPRRMSVWPAAIQTLTPLGIGIIAVSAQGPAAVLRRPRPGQLARNSRQARSRLFQPSRAGSRRRQHLRRADRRPRWRRSDLDGNKSRHGLAAQPTLARLAKLILPNDREEELFRNHRPGFKTFWQAAAVAKLSERDVDA
jgi:hypothetical protein